MGKRQANEGEPSKSDMIRAYKQAHPEMGPTQIARELAAETGLPFSAALVSNVLGKANSLGTRRGRDAHSAPDIQKFPGEAVAKAAELIKAAGGPEQAERVLRQVVEIAKILG